jgi:hypothetical protein
MLRIRTLNYLTSFDDFFDFFGFLGSSAARRSELLSAVE